MKTESLKIERFTLKVGDFNYRIQREEDQDGEVYLEIRTDTGHTLEPTEFVKVHAELKLNYTNQLNYCGSPELVGCFQGAALRRI